MIEYVTIPEERIKILKKNTDWENEIKRFLDIDIKVDDVIVLEGDVLPVLRAKEIFKAFGRGFKFSDCLDLLDEDYVLDVLNITEFVGKSKERQTTIKGRVIGSEGRMKKMIEKAADVKIVVYGKTVSIIGKPENVKIAEEAIKMLLSGSKHNKVYRFLNEHKVI